MNRRGYNLIDLILVLVLVFGLGVAAALVAEWLGADREMSGRIGLWTALGLFAFHLFVGPILELLKPIPRRDQDHDQDQGADSA